MEGAVIHAAVSAVCCWALVELLEVRRGLLQPDGRQLLLPFRGRCAGHLHDQQLIDPGRPRQPVEQQAFVPQQGADHRRMGADVTA